MMKIKSWMRKFGKFLDATGLFAKRLVVFIILIILLIFIGALFSSMDIFSMGDYGFFVWSSFLISFIVFLINYISAQTQFISVLNEVKLHDENE